MTHLLHLFSKWNIFPVFILFLLLAIGIFVVSCSPRSNGANGQKIPVEAGTSDSSQGSDAQATQTRIPVTLSEGKPQTQSTPTAASTASGEPLSEDEVQAVLARLPALPTEAGDQVDFKLAQGPTPPPRTGNTISQPFPPQETAVQPTQAAAGALQVLRYSPEGEIATAPFISVTFNQPMVPLATLSDLAAKDVPVVITPALEGTWRWVGAKTLTFEYASDAIDRLPKATEYTVTVPAGTRSAEGGELAQAVTWKFTTPPVKITSSYPYNTPQGQNPLFFIAFDQRIDPTAMLKSIQVQAGTRTVAVKLAGDADVEADPQVKSLVKNTLEGRWLAFKAQEPLPLETQITTTVLVGAPSAEGPLVTKDPQSYSFSTYAPLRITEHGCSWYSEQCTPLTPLYIRFNNPIDTNAFTDGMLTIKPELPGVSANAYGDTITIQGQTQGQTTYTITVSADVQDVFGQKLGKDQSLTFKIGPANATLFGPEQVLVTLDPASTKPVFSVYLINYTKLDLQIYSVQPSDWPAFKQYLRDADRTDVKPVIPGKQVLNKTLAVEASADKLTQVDVDLTPYLNQGLGHLVVIVNPHPGLLQKNDYQPSVRAWVQATQIGLDAYSDAGDMVAWATALKDGAPLNGVTIAGGASGGQTPGQAVTDDSGLARFAIPNGASFLVASKGSDRAILPYSTYYWDDSGWQVRPVYDELRWYVFDDRQMYRPGEDVHIKGWLRRVGGKQDGDVSLAGSALTAVQYTISDPQGNSITTGEAKVNSMGGFDLSFTIPETVNLGGASISFQALGSLADLTNTQYYHGFQIQEFRTPEFAVTAHNQSAGPFFAGGSADVAVDAKYYAGDPLPGADVTWQVRTTPSSYAPPNWPDFTFGSWTPWWYSRGSLVESAYDFGGPVSSGGDVKTFTGVTDANGTHSLHLDFESPASPSPITVTAEATVMDVNRQAWTGSTSLLVHPADLYVGLRSDRYFVSRGTPLKIDFIVTDLDGKPVSDRPVVIRAARLEWKYRAGSWKEEEVDVQTCNQGSQSQPGSCTFKTDIGGSYRITAQVTDSSGRLNQTVLTRWVSGGQQPTVNKVEQEQVTLIPDKESYQPGDTAEILVQSPFSPAEGLLTLSRSGIVSTQRFQVTDGTATLKIPILDEYTPNLNVQVDLNGSAVRTDAAGQILTNLPARPAFATGQLDLKIPPLQRTLSVTAVPDQPELQPGEETSVAVSVKDAAGNPVSGAEVSLVVVDEAILSLTNYTQADPIGVFYTDRPADVLSQYGRASIVLVDPTTLAQHAQQSLQKSVEMPAAADAAGAMPMATQAMEESARAFGATNGAAQPQIRVRSDFNPLAAFAPAVSTGSDGQARVTVKVPDNLTRYRIMAVAVDESRKFGSGESSLTARQALMVRPSAPRFLNFGDRFELPVVLQNQTAADLTVDVALRATNLELTGAAGLRVTVPAHNRIEVRFPAAALKAGTARFQVAAVSGSYSDAAVIDLPVYTPATTEAFATYGTLDQGMAIQPIQAPSGVFTQFGGLEIDTSSTALQTLTDAVIYLQTYPYECSEQISSRILGIASLRDVLTAFHSKDLPSPAELEATVDKDIARLKGMQNNDGGFPYWQKGRDSVPFNTVHVALALQAAEQKGYTVPPEMKQAVLAYLQQIENYYPSWYSEHTRATLSAYALFVRDQMGDSDPQKALQLIDKTGLDKLDLDAVGWLWQVLIDQPSASDQLAKIRRLVANRVVETAGAANFTTTYNEQSYLLLNSDRRTDAILLSALISDDPKSDLIAKVVNGLLAHREKGHWSNTQENVFVLLALDKYFNTFEAQTPEFVARIWLGDAYAGDHAYNGRTTERQETTIPMAALTDTIPAGSTQDLVLSKEGTGRLYYRLGLSYAPTDLKLDALDMGFVVQRAYEALDDPADVTRDASGVWHIKAGARVRVSLTMVASDRRYHVALADPLPAGLEIVNPSLAVSGSVPQDPSSSGYRYGWWWWGTWYEYQNLRDERAEAFTSLLWDGVYTYSYVARATTPGTFVVPPAKAEEMYSPEVFGRSASDTVIVQ
jgi:uncharacterized protein YfaS (alpha-2-macroglobulin family)